MPTEAQLCNCGNIPGFHYPGVLGCRDHSLGQDRWAEPWVKPKDESPPDTERDPVPAPQTETDAKWATMGKVLEAAHVWRIGRTKTGDIDTDALIDAVDAFFGKDGMNAFR